MNAPFDQLEARPLYPNHIYGLWSTKFSDEQLQFLWDEINAIQDSDFKREQNPSKRDELVGHLEHEYTLSPEVHDRLDELLQPLLEVQISQNKSFQYKTAVCDQDWPIRLEKSWVNFQKKYEYNPVHHHTGLFSFVLWLKIPYNRPDEDNYPNAPKKSVGAMNGCFHTFFTDQFGTICDMSVALDPTYDNICLMFPSEAKHCVYPFYTSDEYRISVSGNFAYRTKTK